MKMQVGLLKWNLELGKIFKAHPPVLTLRLLFLLSI